MKQLTEDLLPKSTVLTIKGWLWIEDWIDQEVARLNKGFKDYAYRRDRNGFVSIWIDQRKLTIKSGIHPSSDYYRKEIESNHVTV